MGMSLAPAWCSALAEKGNFVQGLTDQETQFKKWNGFERILFTHELLLGRNAVSETTPSGPAYPVGEAAFLCEHEGLLYGAFWLGYKEEEYFHIGDIPKGLMVVPSALTLTRIMKRIMKEHDCGEVIDDDLDVVGKRMPATDDQIFLLIDTLAIPHRICVRPGVAAQARVWDCICTAFCEQGLEYDGDATGKYIRMGDYVFGRSDLLNRKFLEYNFPGGVV